MRARDAGTKGSKLKDKLNNFSLLSTSRIKIGIPVLAVVKQVDECLRVAGGRRVVHGAQALVVPQGGVGLVL